MKLSHLCPLAALCLLLAACGESDKEEVKQWMAQTRAQTAVHVPPIAAPKTFTPFTYTAKDAVDPFSQSKLTAELARVAANSNNPYKPDLTRKKEPLEAFPLDTMRMVGMISKGGITYGVLAIDRNIYKVKAGDHLGQNYGLITAVSEDAITVREIVQDAAGEWTERMAKLELQESKEKSK